MWDSVTLWVGTAAVAATAIVVLVLDRREARIREQARVRGAVPAVEIHPELGCVVGYRIWFFGTIDAASRLRAGVFGPWHFRRAGRRRGLVSLYHGEQIWPAGEPAYAALDDGAGIHAFLSEREMLSYLRLHAGARRLVGGSVGLAGDIVVHERGIRATHAYPLRISVGPRKLRREVARLYGCESA